MTRKQVIIPGFRCPSDHRPECKKLLSGQQHGKGDDRWFYTVITDDGAVALTVSVYSRWYRGVYTPRDYPETTDSAFCSLFPIATEQLVSGASDCTNLAGGKCFAAGRPQSLDNDDWFPKIGWRNDPSGEQPEEFWRMLERALSERAAEIAKERVDLTHALCPTCRGERVVPITVAREVMK